jgi:hypothetical protein
VGEDEWPVEYYQGRDGSTPVADYVDRLDWVVQAAVTRVELLLAQLGPKMGSEAGRAYCGKVRGHDELGHARAVARGGSETYPDVGLFFGIQPDGTVVILHAYEWKSWSPDANVVKVASDRAKAEGCVERWWDVQEAAR